MPLSRPPLVVCRRGIVAVALVVASLTWASLAGAAIPQGNLVKNPGAEQPAAPATAAEHAAPTGWETSSNFTVMAYGRTAFPPTSVSDAIGGGSNFFAGGPGPAEANSVAAQVVDFSAAATEIDAGRVRASLSAYLGGVGSQDDGASVTVAFKSEALGDGTELGSPLTVGPVTAATAEPCGAIEGARDLGSGWAAAADLRCWTAFASTTKRANGRICSHLTSGANRDRANRLLPSARVTPD